MMHCSVRVCLCVWLCVSCKCRGAWLQHNGRCTLTKVHGRGSIALAHHKVTLQGNLGSQNQD